MKPQKIKLFCRGKGGANASMFWEGGDITIGEGSFARTLVASSAPATLRKKRVSLLADGTLVRDGDRLRFTRSVTARSPSAASALVLGRSSNGWTEWKTEDGLTMDQAVRYAETKVPQQFDEHMSRGMWSKVASLNSRYPDTFDYTVYDRLYEKYKNNMPRGGVIFRNNLKLLEAEDCAKCFYRLEVDTYGRGCVHDCAWCYSKSTLSTRKYWNEPQPFPIDITETRKLFHRIFETDKASPWRKLFERRVPLRIGAMSDAFMQIV